MNFGNHAYDRHLESELDRYLESQEWRPCDKCRKHFIYCKKWESCYEADKEARYDRFTKYLEELGYNERH